MSNQILITGGLGYIGSHMAIYLCNLGYRVVIVDIETVHKEIIINRMNKCIRDSSYYTLFHLNILDKNHLE